MTSGHISLRVVLWCMLAWTLTVACPPHAAASALHVLPDPPAVPAAIDHGHACEHLLAPATDLLVPRRPAAGAARLMESDPFPDASWTELPPAPRVWDQAAAYDTRRDRMVVFGGTLFNGSCADGVWVQDLASGDWRELRPLGEPPPPCTNNTVIYDPIGDRLIVCGGGGTSPGTVWALSMPDPPTWTEIRASGTPPALSGHTAILDPLRNRMVVFGGGPHPQNSTWTMSLGEEPEWHEIVASNVPAGRYRHAAAYDPVRDRMLVFGGSTGQGLPGLSNEVWALPLSGPAEWERIVATGSQPSPRQGSAIYDPVHDALLVFGGHQNVQPYLRSDAWLLPLGSDPQWTRLADAPTARWHHTTLLDPLRNRMVVFGGFPPVDNQSWTLSLTSEEGWQPLGGTGPAARGASTAAYDPRRQRMIVHGGVDWFGPLIIYSDTWAMSTREPWRWVPLEAHGTHPPARYAHTGIFDEVNDRLIIFGGHGTDRVMNDVWALEMDGLPRWQRLEATGEAPAPRAGHSAVYDRARQRMFVFGGRADGEQGPDFFSDVWELSLAGPPRWRRLQTSGVAPPARARHAAIYDPLNKEMIVFGGGFYSNATQYFYLLGDTWALSLRGVPRWRLVAEESRVPLTDPGRRDRHIAVYDGANHRMLVYGGSHDGGPYAFSDLWALPLAGPPPSGLARRAGDGHPPGHPVEAAATWQWLQTTGPTPPGRSEHCAIFDPVGNALIAFGGGAGEPLRDTWAAVVGAGERGAISGGTAAAGEIVTPVPHALARGVSGSELIVETVLGPSSGGGWVVAFATPAAGRARVDILDVTGRRLASSTTDVPSSGRRSVTLAGGSSAPPGIYFVRIQQHSRITVRKVFVTQVASVARR